MSAADRSYWIGVAFGMLAMVVAYLIRGGARG